MSGIRASRACWITRSGDPRIRALLDSDTRPQRGLKFVIQLLDLSVLVRDICGLLKTSISKTVQIQLNLGDRLPAIEGDAIQIQQLIMNLVINGAEAIGADKIGTVFITTGVEDVDRDWLAQAVGADESAPGKFVSLEVHDTGCGMDDGTLAHIFDPFFTTKFTGRGLGLAAALGIVRGHKGALKVSSAPGMGSKFQVLFPAGDKTASELKPTARREKFAGRGVILVADDEDVVRKVTKSMLESYGYTVILAEDGLQATEIFGQRREEIALIILDLTMPVMNGEEALGRLRLIDPNVPILLSSGYNELEAIARFQGKGLDGFVQKPYTSAGLAEKLKAALGES